MRKTVIASSSTGYKIIRKNDKWQYIKFSKNSGKIVKIVFTGEVDDDYDTILKIGNKLIRNDP
jgi:hypothetical protein